MRKLTIFFILFLAFTVSQNVYSQNITYATKQIGRWRLERFPINYYKPAFKTITQKVPIVGKIALYQEVNQYGQNDGLRVEMQTDFVSPHTIYYYKKGVVVYSAYFFTNSLKAYEIVNKNLNDQLDGPQIKRTLTNNTVQEVVELFKNGELIKTNQPDNSPVINFADGLLQGKFNYQYNNSTFQGTAVNGELSYFKKNNYGDIYEYKIIGDEIKVAVIAGSDAGTKQSYQIKSHLKITNDKSLSDKDDKYVFWDRGLDLFDVVNKMRFYTIQPYTTILNYQDNLLNGVFQYRKNTEDGVDDYQGLAVNGFIKSLKKTSKSFNSTSNETSIINITEYKIENDSVYVYDYKNEIKTLRDSYKAYKKLIITNSESNSQKPGYYFLDDISLLRVIEKMRYVD